MKACINCYTINFKENEPIISPGILTKDLFDFQPDAEIITLPQAKICRYAVETIFQSLPNSATKLWVVSTEKDLFYYRFFSAYNSEENKNFYLNFEYPIPCKVPNDLISNAVLSNYNKFIIKLPINTSFKLNGTFFLLKDHIFTL